MNRPLLHHFLPLAAVASAIPSTGCSHGMSGHGVTNAVYQKALSDAQKSGMTVTCAAMAQPLPTADQNAAPIYVQLTAVRNARPLSKADQSAELASSHLGTALSAQQLMDARSLLARRSDILQLTQPES